MTAARAAADKGGHDTLVLEVARVLVIVDWFVITSGSNRRQVFTIADEVKAAMRETNGSAPVRSEGLDDGRWVLLDFGDVVVHIFLDDVRELYSLERLWRDVPLLDWEAVA